MESTVQHRRPRRRVVRDSTITRAWDVVLADVDPELRPLIVAYVGNLREGQEIRAKITTALMYSPLRWSDIQAIASSALS